MSEDFRPLKLKVLEDGIILCPQCNQSFVHILKTTTTLRDVDALHLDIVRPNGKEKKGVVELVHEEAIRGGRNYSIELHYHCEQGCEGIVKFTHHEGDTRLTHKPKRSKA